MADTAEPVLDPDVIDTLRLLNEPGQPDVVREVLSLFLSDAPSRIQAIAGAVKTGDTAGLQRAAHTMKGASGTIGALRLQQTCRALEELGRHNSIDGAVSKLEELEREYASVKAAIDQLLL